jgi:hypothetical protein
MTGQKQSWAWLKAKYKCDMIPAPVPGGAGPSAAFRLVRIDETAHNAGFIVQCRNADAGPQPGQPIAQWWDGVQNDEKKVNITGTGVKSIYHTEVLIERTNANGDIGFPYNAGGVIHENGGPYTFWILSPSLPSDALIRAGWLGGTNYHSPGRLTFQIVEGNPTPEPEPQPQPTSDLAFVQRLLVAGSIVPGQTTPEQAVRRALAIAEELKKQTAANQP